RAPAPPTPGLPGSGPIFVPAYAATTLTIVAPGNGIVGLTWIPIPTANMYRIYQAPSSAGPAGFPVVPTINQPNRQAVNNANLTNLTPGATYIVQVRAVDATGVESVSPSSALTTPSIGR